MTCHEPTRGSVLYSRTTSFSPRSHQVPLKFLCPYIVTQMDKSIVIKNVYSFCKEEATRGRLRIRLDKVVDRVVAMLKVGKRTVFR